MSKAISLLCASCVLVLLLSTVLVTGSIAQNATPVAPNSIQVSRVQYDGNNGNPYVSPYSFPEIFNDQAGCTTGNQICNIAGIEGSIYIDQFNSVPGSPVFGTLPLPSTGTPVTTFPAPEPGSYITTSFSSKSEGALMLSVDGNYLTYMGYQGNSQLDNVSNSYSLEPANDLSPNSYTMDPSIGTALGGISAATESSTTVTLTLISPLSIALPAGSYVTVGGMSTSGYNGTWPTTLAASIGSSTVTIGPLPKSLAACSTQSACGGTATYDPPYPFYDREVALIGAGGLISLTPIDNSNSGDNPRAAITVDGNEFYTVGNSDSTTATPSTGPNNPGLTIGARCATPEQSQSYQLGTYTATDRSDESAKKHIKDNNWRGVGIYNDGNGNLQLYVSKGSGGNGDDGLFQVGSPLPSCTLGGTDTTNTITELLGAQATVPNGQAFQTSPYLPFGFWMANPTTLYIADEGNPPSYTGGSSPSFQNSTNGTFTLPQLANGVFASDPYAGLEKWTLVNGTWTYAYTIQAGLNMYQPVTFTGYNDINGAPIQSYTYGLRNMTGFNNGDGTATIYAVTAQFSAASGGEPDPDSIVGITDTIAATTLPASEQFVTLQTSSSQEVFRGVAYVPPAPGFTRAEQAISFTSEGTLTYGAAPVTLTATSTSGWPISYSVSSGPGTISGDVLTITGAGTIVVQANQSGNTDYVPATATQTITVNQALLLVTPNNASSTYGGTLPTFTATFSGFVNGDSSTVVSGSPALTTPATSASGVGAYPINAALGTLSAQNYTFTFGSGTLTINPALLTVTPNNATTTYGTIPGFTASITGFVNGDNQTVVSGSPVLSTTATTTSPVGAYPINASQGTLSASNYTFTFGTGTLTINPASQTITFTTPAPGSAAYNSQFTVVASASSGLPVTFTSSGVCTNVAATYTMTNGIGNCTVKASQSGNGNYTAAPTVSETTMAAQATQTVSFTGAPATAVFGSTFSVQATTNSGLPVIITATGTCSVAGTVVSINGASGTCTVSAVWNGNNDYKQATATQSTTEEQATPVVTWAPPAAITYGTKLSAAQNDATANVRGTFKYSPANGVYLLAGSQTLSVTFTPTNRTDYTAATASVGLQVQQATTTTTITSSSTTVTMNIDNVALATLDFHVGNTYKPTGGVTLTASTGEVCSGTVSAGTGNGFCKLTFVTTGTRTITATYSGDGNHTGSTNSGQTITVTVNPH